MHPSTGSGQVHRPYLTGRALLPRINAVAESGTPPGHRSGFVALAGKPNVGKSTLVNRYVGQSIAAVSPRPQTTRRNQLGILTLPQAQLIFIDTPGIHQPMHKLGARMNAWADQALRDSDMVLAMFDLTSPPGDEDLRVAERVRASAADRPVLLALNKVDAVSEEEVDRRGAEYASLLAEAERHNVSASRGDGCPALLDRLVALLPAGPRYYPEDQITDTYERDIAVDLIRSACLRLLRHEVPHAVAVRLDEYQERGQEGAYLAATLFVERESQKPIVIGKGGKMLKEIGTQARREIEALTGRRIFLDLRVKVEPGWRDDEASLERFGYASVPRRRGPDRP